MPACLVIPASFTPPFYNALYLHTMGDTLMIADQVTQELVCMRPNGEVLWKKAGKSGEGLDIFME